MYLPYQNQDLLISFGLLLHRRIHTKGPTFGIIDKELKEAIINWRKEIWSRDFGDGPVDNESLSSFGLELARAPEIGVICPNLESNFTTVR